jgi:hypothetical protein
LELISDPALVTFSVRYVFKNILPMTTIYIYRCSGCWRWSHFSIRRTYTCAKSGLSALKLVSYTGDVTISLRMVNEDISWILYKFYYARLHDRYYKLPISLVSKVGSPFILLVLVLLAWLTAMVWWNNCRIVCARYSIRQHSRVALLLLLVVHLWSKVAWKIHHQPNMLTIRKCVTVHDLSYHMVSWMYSLWSIAIRQFQ